MSLEKELADLVQRFRDATDDYVHALSRSGAESLADEWRYNIGDLLGDFTQIGKALVDAYAARQPEKIPEAMKWFVSQAIVQPEIHTRGHITRLKDILEGRLPSWPEGEIQSDSGQGLGACDIELWRVMGKVRRATDDYVAQLEAAGMVELGRLWRDALWKMTWEAWSSGELLVSLYIPLTKDIPGMMRRFFRKTHEAEANCRGPMARLEDAVK